ncbi:hypothetical protein DID88_002764 [Monilinia fructigena]|uniref:Transcriptional activator HAP2 n=1 Tax=Monilinia fructigena TaxID=38457 RepID=A0A395INL8_9HELO|nr:hypothetical protein DID88_002764 [Monilinia fructigena]
MSTQQVASPAVPSAQPLMKPCASVIGIRTFHVSTSSTTSQSPELVSGAVEESPLYVNAKQFHRILKRRVARQRLEKHFD